MIDFDAVFSSKLVSYTRTVFGTGTINNEGAWVEGVGLDTTFNAVDLQPLKMNELSNLDDGEKNFSYVKIYTTTALNNGDNVTHSNGDKYQVRQSENRINHFKIYLRLIE